MSGNSSNSAVYEALVALVWDTAQATFRTHADNYAAEYSEAMRAWRQAKLPEAQRPQFDLADLRSRIWQNCLEDARIRVHDRLSIEIDLDHVVGPT